jgi:4-hydroxy 2-oxovalerate aldolase
MEVTISDPTLRDGNHAVGHKITLEQIKKYAKAADQSGVAIIEVGHGNGLGASSLQLGFAAHSDRDMLRCAREQISTAKLGIHIIPGFGKLSDIKIAMEEGVDIFRVAAHCTEADTTERYINYLSEHGKESHGVLMMSHMASKETLLYESLKMQAYGAKAIILMDSAGAYTPIDTTSKVSWISDHVEIPVGFHAHNNLGLSIANSIAAVQSGASIIDATIKGFGAGAGNTSLEVLIAVLGKYGYKTKANLNDILNLADSAEQFLVKKSPSIQTRNISSGINGVFSGFDKHVMEAAKKYKLNEQDIYKELGKRNVVAGQEDIIIEVCEAFQIRGITDETY